MNLLQNVLLLTMVAGFVSAGADYGECISALSCLQNPPEPQPGPPGPQGPTGDRGPIGLRGSTGLRGPAGSCSCDLDHYKNEISLQTRRDTLMARQHVCYTYKSSTGKVFCMSRNSMNYHEAEKFCQSLSTKLATASMRSKEMKNEVVSSLIRVQSNGDRFWIGLNDLEHEGQWYFIDGVQSTQANTDWKENEPNNLDNEDCGLIWKFANYEINDGDCILSAGQALCEL